MNNKIFKIVMLIMVLSLCYCQTETSNNTADQNDNIYEDNLSASNNNQPENDPYGLSSLSETDQIKYYLEKISREYVSPIEETRRDNYDSYFAVHLDENGIVIKEETYQDYQLSAITYFLYYANGNLSKKMVFNADMLPNGVWKYYNEQGINITIEEYSDGKISKRVEYYPETRTIKREETYGDGKIIVANEYNENGNLVKTEEYDEMILELNEDQQEIEKLVDLWTYYNDSGLDQDIRTEFYDQDGIMYRYSTTEWDRFGIKKQETFVLDPALGQFKIFQMSEVERDDRGRLLIERKLIYTDDGIIEQVRDINR